MSITKETFRLAGQAIRKSRQGEHFTNKECLAAVEVLDLVQEFAIAANLRRSPRLDSTLAHSNPLCTA